MKKRFLFFLFLWPIALIAQRTWVEDPNVMLRESPGHFKKIQVSGGLTVYLSPGSEEKIAVGGTSADLASQIKTELKGETLMISAHSEGNWNRKMKKANVYISFTELEKVTAGGAVQIYLEGKPRLPRLEISLSGASDMKGSLETERLDVNISGASDVNLSGMATRCHFTLSGASDFKAYELETMYCEAKASGASDARILVTKELNVQASGASSIHYKGEALLKQADVSDSSEVSKKWD